MQPPQPEANDKTWLSVVAVELRCALATVQLLLRHRLRLPHDLLDEEIGFGDGTTSRVYRETVMSGLRVAPRVVLAVRFRLRLIDNRRAWHALFRLESMFNTLLFAAHPGFHTKLWVTDLETGYYRGIYEWQDSRSAVEYLETLRVVLRPWVEPDSFAYRILDTSREDYLSGRLADEQSPQSDELWWLPVASKQGRDPDSGPGPGVVASTESGSARR